MNRDGLWTVLVLSLVPAAIVAQGIADIRIVTPRDFGYTIGDRFRHEMHLILNEPIRLDMATLPEAGRLNRWLELSAAEVDVRHLDQSAHYRITVEYQIFNAPQELTSVTVQQLEFMTTGGANRIPVFMPEWTFSIGPVTNSKARENLSLQPDRQPKEIPVRGRYLRLLTWTMLIGGLLLYLAYRRFVLPRLRRNRYPFSTALRDLRKLQRVGTDPESYRLALKAFHAAMNSTAGQVVFAADLNDFVSSNSTYAELRSDLATLYARSEDVFFKDADTAEHDSAWHELLDICRRCRELERSAA